MVGSAAPRSKVTLQIAALLVSLLTIVAPLGYARWQSQVDTLRTAQAETRNYAALIESQFRFTLGRTEDRLLKIVQSIPYEAFDATAAPRFSMGINTYLATSADNFPDLFAIRVFDAEGELLYTSGVERTAQAKWDDDIVFRHARASRKTGLLFSEARQIGSTGNFGIAVSHAVIDAQGKFRGLVLAAITLDGCRKMFESMSIGAKGIAVIRHSGNFNTVPRMPFIERQMNIQEDANNPLRVAVREGKSKGTLEFVSNSDQEIRIFSYQLVSGYPYYVAVGLARDEVLANWRTQTKVIGAVTFLLVMIVFVLLRRSWHLSESPT